MIIVYYAELFVIFIASKPFPVNVNRFGSKKGSIIVQFFSAFPNTWVHKYLTLTLYSVAIKI